MKLFNLASKKAFCILALTLVLTGGLLSCTSTGASAGKQDIRVYAGLGRPDDPLPFMEKVRTGVLPGGLRYFILENSRPENRAYLTLAVNAGSVLESDDEQGLAHFVEHMAFNGTTRFPQLELVNYLRTLGMRFGPEVNAYTTYDRTVYGIEVPVEAAAGVKRIPAKALAVLDDWTRAIIFDPDAVDNERGVIMEEYRSRLGARDRVRRQLLPILLKGSPYAVRNPIGLPEIIQNAPAEQLVGFYRRWYRPDNMALIIVGDFDGAALEAELASHFSSASPPEALVRPHYDLPAPKKGNFQVTHITDPELTYTQVGLYSKRSPQLVRGTLGEYREGLIDVLLDRMLGFRFDEASQKPDAPYTGAGAGNTRYGTSSRFYVLLAEAKTGGAEASLQELLREKESMRRFGFTETELGIAKGSLLSDIAQMVSEQDRQQSERYVSTLTDYYLDGETFPDIEWEYMAVGKLLPGITAADIKRAVQDYFAADDLQIFVIAPEAEKENLPSEERVRQLVNASTRLKLTAPKDTATEGALVAHEPKAGAIRSESIDKETGAYIWETENGARIILKQTKNRNNEVVLYSMARGGTVSAGADEYVSAILAAEMASASGLGPWSRPQLVKLLADKQVSLSFWTGGYSRGFQGSAATADVQTLFEMLYLSFTDPRLDGDAIAALLDSYRTSLAQRSEDPDTVFSDAITRIVSGGHPYFKPLEVSDLSKADTAQAAAFINRSLNPGDYTFIFTGNLDPAQLRPLVETWLASIPATKPWNTWTDPRIQRPGKIAEKVYKGKEERSAVFMGWYDPMPFTEEQSAIASVLSEYLDIQMTEDIREKLGGVYSIGVGVSISPVPMGELVMQVYFECDPKRADELSEAVETLLRQVAAGPIDNDTFTKSVEALKKNWESSVESNLYIAQSYANSSVLLDTPLSRLDQRPGLYEKVSPAQIQELCRRILPHGPTRVVLYPEGWN
ncbi:MAG: insulinase family protein [Treponema sp.]|jgi:zinc protease|nr:insulinase family protein [Treponema sp.]